MNAFYEETDQLTFTEELTTAAIEGLPADAVLPC